MAKDNVSEEFISLGPWGGSGGTEWSCMFDFGIINGIEIHHGDCVDSLSFRSGNDISKFGGDGGTNIHVVTIDSPSEYLTSISGTFGNYGGNVVIRSLSFYTNLTTNGPYGTVTGTAFTIPIKYGMVVGFHGRAGQYINAIGLYVIPTSQSSKTSQEFTKNEQANINDQRISLGPWGGPDGDLEWSCKFHDGISRIVIRHGECIDFVAFGSGDNADSGFGGTGGGSTTKVDIDWPTEYLIGISGTFESWTHSNSAITIRSLCFYTNLNTYGPYGVESGYAFTIPIRFGKVIGFHGRAGKYIYSIGVHVIPTSLFSQPNQEFTKNEQVAELSKALFPCGPGPWGGPGGKPWDDGVFTSIKKILIRQGNNGILNAIQFEYEKSDGKAVKSGWFGGSGVGSINQVNLDCPSEYLISVSGFFGPADEGKPGFEAINSLTFYTTKGKYGPFGKEVGTYFASPSGGKIVGFFGRSGAYLDAIGVHMEYF